jgi:hypothetical protein
MSPPAGCVRSDLRWVKLGSQRRPRAVNALSLDGRVSHDLGGDLLQGLNLTGHSARTATPGSKAGRVCELGGASWFLLGHRVVSALDPFRGPCDGHLTRRRCRLPDAGQPHYWRRHQPQAPQARPSRPSDRRTVPHPGRSPSTPGQPQQPHARPIPDRIERHPLSGPNLGSSRRPVAAPGVWPTTGACARTLQGALRRCHERAFRGASGSRTRRAPRRALR